jgi:Family of unknown function (DUF6338)
LILAVAAFGPGYVYLRAAERRSARASRSGLVEAVELAVLGAFASTVALLIIGCLADATGLADVRAFVSHPHTYLARHPLKILWLVALSLALAYGIAWGAALLVHRKDATIRPAGSAWSEVLTDRCPPGHGVRVTAELRDGRKVQGTYGGMTLGADENRELYLRGPMRQLVGSRQTSLPDAFLVLRECDILAISGNYEAP